MPVTTSYITSTGSPTLRPPMAYPSNPRATVSPRARLAQALVDRLPARCRTAPGRGWSPRRRGARGRRRRRGNANGTGAPSAASAASRPRPPARTRGSWRTRRTPWRRRTRAGPGCRSRSRGVSRCRLPSRCDRNETPSSSISRRSARLNTWYPPLSVRMGRSQPMKRCSPARPRDEAGAGAQVQVIGVGEDDLRPEADDVAVRQPPDGPPRAHRRERGGADDPVRRADLARARPPVAVGHAKREPAVGLRHIMSGVRDAAVYYAHS